MKLVNLCFSVLYIFGMLTHLVEFRFVYRLTLVLLLLRDVFQMVQKAWMRAMSTRAAIRPRTMYRRVSDRSKNESSVSLALGSEALLSEN